MLDAIHEQTGVGYTGSDVWSKFNTPRKEKWICCPDCKHRVFPVKFHTRQIKNREKITVVSHFRLESDTICIHKESDEHKKLKVLVAQLIENKEVMLKVNGQSVGWNTLKFKSIPKLAFRWEQKEADRRADVMFEFESIHPTLGKGIIFEVQISAITPTEIYERERDWMLYGWSLVWIEPDMFDGGYGIKEQEIIINRPFLFSAIQYMKMEKERMDDTIITMTSLLAEIDLEKTRVIDEIRGEARQLFDVEVKNFKETEFDKMRGTVMKNLLNLEKWTTKTCRTCCYGTPGKDRDRQIVNGLIACWWNKNQGISRRPESREQFDVCENYLRRGSSRSERY